jgi:large subunit ribosomal protein L18e
MTQFSKRIQRKNQALQRLIFDLIEAGRENDAPIWRTTAETLSAPTRQQPTVNLHDLNEVEGDDILLIPGKVLGSGILTQEDITVAAHKYSSSAREAIEEQGTAMTIRELLDNNRTGENVRIIT